MEHTSPTFDDFYTAVYNSSYFSYSQAVGDVIGREISFPLGQISRILSNASRGWLDEVHLLPGHVQTFRVGLRHVIANTDENNTEQIAFMAACVNLDNAYGDLLRGQGG